MHTTQKELTIPPEIVDIKRDNDIHWLAAFRIKAGLTIEDVAKALNISNLGYAVHECTDKPCREVLFTVSILAGVQPELLLDLYYGEN